MVYLLHAPLVPSLGNLPSPLRIPHAHSLDDPTQVPSQLQKPIHLAIRACPYENVPLVPHQPRYLAERFDCLEVGSQMNVASHDHTY